MGNTLSTLNCIHFEIMVDPCNLISTHRDRAALCKGNHMRPSTIKD